MKQIIPWVFVVALLSFPALAGENGKKPVDPAKEFWDFGTRVCEYLPGEMERNACHFPKRDFIKQNPPPCAAKDRAVYLLRLSQALCEETHRVKDKATGGKVEKIEPKHASECWKQVIHEITGKDAKPFEEGQSYDLSKVTQAVAWAGAVCVGKDRYHDIGADCMHEKITGLEAMFTLQGISEGPPKATFVCSEGGGDPSLAEGGTAPAKPDVQPRIVTTAELPAGPGGAAVVK